MCNIIKNSTLEMAHVNPFGFSLSKFLGLFCVLKDTQGLKWGNKVRRWSSLWRWLSGEWVSGCTEERVLELSLQVYSQFLSKACQGQVLHRTRQTVVGQFNEHRDLSLVDKQCLRSTICTSLVIVKAEGIQARADTLIFRSLSPVTESRI